MGSGHHAVPISVLMCWSKYLFQTRLTTLPGSRRDGIFLPIHSRVMLELLTTAFLIILNLVCSGVTFSYMFKSKFGCCKPLDSTPSIGLSFKGPFNEFSII